MVTLNLKNKRKRNRSASLAMTEVFVRNREWPRVIPYKIGIKT